MGAQYRLPSTKLKNTSPANVIKKMETPNLNFKVSNGDIEAPTRTIKLQFEIGNWMFKESFIIAAKKRVQYSDRHSSRIRVRSLMPVKYFPYAITSQPDKLTAINHKMLVRNQTTLLPDLSCRGPPIKCGHDEHNIRPVNVPRGQTNCES